MKKQVVIGLLVMLCSTKAMAQLQQLQPPRFGQVYIEANTQNKQRITDVGGATYHLGGVSIGMMLPVYAKTFRQRNDTTPASRMAFTIHSAVSASNLTISYLPQERILLNPQLSIASYYNFKRKNMFMLTGRVLLNEDEFTINYPEPRYTFSALYSRRVNQHLSYYLGAGYSYVFGEGQFLPLLGGTFSWEKNNRLNLILPVQVSYRTRLSTKLRLSVYARPQGGVNRFENRLTISDSSQKTVVFRRKSTILGAAFSYWVKENMAIVVDPAFLFAPKIAFADDEESSLKYIDNNLSRGVQLRVMLIWRPWQNAIRNQQQRGKTTEEEDSFLLGF